MRSVAKISEKFQNNMPSIDEIINTEIDSVTDSQLRQVIRTILLTKNDIEIPTEILEQLEFWKNVDPNQARLNASRYVEDTMNCFYQYFKSGANHIDNPALKPDGAFARNMIAHFDINPGMSKYEMGLFCNYIANLSQKSVDIQKVFFDSFPPKSSDEIACLGGTGTRMTQLNQQLTVSEADKILLDIHQLLMMQLADRLKRQVPLGNHIHILPYLNFVFGIESKEELEKIDVTFLCPQFDIPAHVLWNEMQGYAEKFKELLKKRGGFPQKVARLKEKLPASHEIEDAISDKERVTLILDETGAANVGDVLRYNDVEEYEWNDDQLAKLSLTQSLPRIFNKEAATERRAKIPAIDLFKLNAPEQIAILLNSDRIVDVEVGIEALWVLGVRTLGNSQYQVKKVVDLVGKDFLEQKISAKVSQLHKEKLDLALTFLSEKKFEKDWDNVIPPKSLHRLIEIGAPTEIIQQFISSGVKIKYDTLNFKKLLSRPDKKELWRSLESSGMVLKENTIDVLFMSAMRDNDVEFASEVAQSLGSRLNPRIFTLNEPFLIWSIESKDENLRRVCNKIPRVYLNMQNIVTGLCPIHYAVMQGSEATFDFLVERRVDLNAIEEEFAWKTPTHLAARLGKVSMIRKLKQYGANIDQIDGFCMRPIHYALKGGYSTAVEELIAGGAKIHPTTLPSLQNFRDNSNSALRKMMTIGEPDLLSFAARYGHVECLAVLEKHGLAVDQKKLDSLAQTALNNGQAEMLKNLLERGASAPEYGVMATVSSQSLNLKKAVLRDQGRVNQVVESGISEMDKAKKMAKSYRIFEDVTNSVLGKLESAARETSRYDVEQWNWLRKTIRSELVKTYEGDSGQLIKDLNLSSSSACSFIPKVLKQAAKIPTYSNSGVERLQKMFAPLIGLDGVGFEEDVKACLVPLEDKTMLREMVNIVEKPSVRARTKGSVRRVVADNTNAVVRE